MLEALDEARRAYIVRALKACNGNVTQAARQFGMNRQYMHRLITQLNIRFRRRQGGNWGNLSNKEG